MSALPHLIEPSPAAITMRFSDGEEVTFTRAEVLRLAEIEFRQLMLAMLSGDPEHASFAKKGKDDQ